MTALVARPATPADAPAIHALLAAAGQALAAQGFHNWATPYPLERIDTDIRTRTVMLVREGDRPVAAWTLGSTPFHAYDPAPWPDPALPAVYLNRLAVDPALQGHGVGAWCLAEIDRWAAEAGGRAIRCDVLAANHRLTAFYQRHGYRRAGSRAHSGWEFVCFEKVLS